MARIAPALLDGKPRMRLWDGGLPHSEASDVGGLPDSSQIAAAFSAATASIRSKRACISLCTLALKAENQRLKAAAIVSTGTQAMAKRAKRVAWWRMALVARISWHYPAAAKVSRSPCAPGTPTTARERWLRE